MTLTRQPVWQAALLLAAAPVAALLAAVILAPRPAYASGGLVLRNDVCVLTIGFYESHFTAYQPENSGNQEFCDHLPDAGDTIFVLDYLHASLKEVPVDFRIIRDVTGKGRFARLEDVEAIDDLEAATLYYAPPQVKDDGTLTVEYSFPETGHYLVVVTAGHPTNDNTYTAVFPLGVGVDRFPWALVGFAVFAVAAGVFLVTMKRIGRSAPEAGA